jgi:CBS domain-containing protein
MDILPFKELVMTTLGDMLQEKGSRVYTIGEWATVHDAAVMMNENRIGALVVVDQQRVVGMFTERDVLRRVVAAEREPALTRVGEVMTTEIACGSPQTTIEEARQVMRDHRIRHLPIVDDDRQLLGLISIGDLNAWRLNGQEATIQFLHEYLYGQ